MKRIVLPVAATLLLGSTAIPAHAAMVFNRIASFPVQENAPDAATTSSEIIAASEDGMLLVYSDSPAGGIGFIDIADPKAPQGAGFLALEGEPTSVTVIGGKAIVGLNTSESLTNPSGQLAVIDLETKRLEQSCELGGQPDSVARNAAGDRIAVAIENERDEDLNDGELPQAPAGFLVLADIDNGVLDCATLTDVDLTGIADVVPEDPEPEFVDFNATDEVVVTLQENNHIVIVDGRTGAVTGDFSAGATSLEGIDTARDGALRFTGSMADVAREPDAVKWLDEERLVTANEGDWKGGSRGFTIFGRDGSVLYESGASMEMEAVRLGHYPDKRNSKGVEPEGLATGSFDGDDLIFVAQERSSLVSVYRDTEGEPEYLQSLPSGIGPEGLVTIPARNLLVTANEEDLREDGLGGSHVMIYQRSEGEASYPQLIADLDAEGRPLGWVALSGAVGDADRPGILYAVSDSVMSAEPAIFTIDATAKPARITAKTIVTRGGDAAQKLDLEGITLDGEGGFWLASEGRSDRLIPHALYHVGADGEILEEVAFPAELLAHEIRFGAEGITRVGSGDETTLWVAIQREWQDDPKGQVKLLGYNLTEKTWSAVRYPLDAAADGAWQGLSEITAHGDYVYLIERDNQIALKANSKKLYRVPAAELQGVAIGEELPLVSKEEVRDLMDDLRAANGYVLDKVESFAVDAAGEAFLITDNDGVDDSSGETLFWSIGTVD
ncbi:MAG TPA: esterase-like activity of phytase family protein [Devosiaceae bacterium]|jgi:hypothetical protein|nr:esterase-like activity of phytase family protein [Devosiaceae bacterium]